VANKRKNFYTTMIKYNGCYYIYFVLNVGNNSRAEDGADNIKPAVVVPKTGYFIYYGHSYPTSMQ
jgi:hypothetical protein